MNSSLERMYQEQGFAVVPECLDSTFEGTAWQPPFRHSDNGSY